MFNKKIYLELIQAIKSVAIQSQEAEYRPCYVNGRRAMFHRWVNTANPALPKGMGANDEKARFFQHRSTHGLVEFEDGSVARVWPSDIRFADGGHFEQGVWLTAEQLGGQRWQRK